MNYLSRSAGSSVAGCNAMDQVDIKLVGFFIFRFLSELLNTSDLLCNQWALWRSSRSATFGIYFVTGENVVSIHAPVQNATAINLPHSMDLTRGKGHPAHSSLDSTLPV